MSNHTHFGLVGTLKQTTPSPYWGKLPYGQNMDAVSLGYKNLANLLHYYTRFGVCSHWRLIDMPIADLYHRNATLYKKTYAKLTPRRSLKRVVKECWGLDKPTTPLVWDSLFRNAYSKVHGFNKNALLGITFSPLFEHAKAQVELKTWLIFETNVQSVPVLQPVSHIPCEYYLL